MRHFIPPQSPHWDLDLLTPDDVCALLKVKKSWLYDAVESGELEAIRLGKQLRFRPSALIRYLDQRVNKVDERPRPADEPSLAKRLTALLHRPNWLPLLPGLTEHGQRHAHHGMLDYLNIRYMLQAERMGSKYLIRAGSTRTSRRNGALI
jgi:excisionase family DNA binding protein